MNRARRAIALLTILLAMLAGCATGPSSGGSSESSSNPPRVRCLTDPSRDATSTSRPMIFLFCVESP